MESLHVPKLLNDNYRRIVKSDYKKAKERKIHKTCAISIVTNSINKIKMIKKGNFDYGI